MRLSDCEHHEGRGRGIDLRGISDIISDKIL
jgi:hypothetical protein